jgi:hypothetical protein
MICFKEDETGYDFDPGDVCDDADDTEFDDYDDDDDYEREWCD